MVMLLAYRFLHLLRNQWLPPDRLKEIQRAKLRPLVVHAYNNVPYYRRLFDAVGIKPNDIRGVEDLSKVPITTKEQLLIYPHNHLVANGVASALCVRMRTSGSLGMPFEVLFRREDKAVWGLLALRGWLANRYHFGHKMLVLSDSRFVPQGKRWFERIGIFRKSYTSIYDDVERQIETAMAVRPDVIRGMPSDVYLLAKAVRERGCSSITPKIVLTSAELMENATRRFINETFGVQLADFYGSIECGWIAWECPAHAGYHLNEDCLIVEFIRDGRPALPGERGEVVVTNLHAYAMPFIRYSVGDVGIPRDTPCPCGRGLPLMQAVEGRTVDCLTLAGGRTISPYQLTCTLEQVPGIQRYQIVQTSQERLVVKVIPNEHFTEQTMVRIKAELAGLLGRGINVEPTLVRELPKDQSGKFRVVKAANQ